MNSTTTSNTIQSAAQMAAAGNYTAAITLLDSIEAGETSIEAQLLRAQIAAQQGNYDESIAYWQNILTQDPGNKLALDGLRRTSDLKSKGAVGFTRTKKYYVIVLFLILGIAILFSFFAGRWTVSHQPMVVNDVAEGDSFYYEINMKLDSLIGKSQVPPQINIDVPGIEKDVNRNKVILRFENGLFSEHTNLKPGANDILKKLAEQLNNNRYRISIHVIGYTDNRQMYKNRMYKDNGSLGFARASTVVEYIRRETDLPADIFTTSSSGTTRPPYPNNTKENRTKNLTVVIEISGNQK